MKIRTFAIIFSFWGLSLIFHTSSNAYAQSPLTGISPTAYIDTLNLPNKETIHKIKLGDFTYNDKKAKQLQLALSKIKRGMWDEAFVAVKDDPTGHKIVLWHKLKDKNSAINEDLKKFRENYTLWPSYHLIKTNYEKIVSRALEEGNKEYLDEFIKEKHTHPKSMIRIGEALLKDEDTFALGEDFIKKALHSRSLEFKDLIYITRNHGSLVKEFYKQKFQNLIWDRDWNLAKYLMSKLPREEMALAKAKLALARNYYNVDFYIMKVQKKMLQDPGLNYERMRWRFNKDLKRTALEILVNTNTLESMGGRPDKWAKYRTYFAREEFEKRRYKSAYDIASAHFLSRGIDFANLEWFAGWIALTFLKDADTARKHFENLWNNVGTPISKSRAAYWTARSSKTDAEKKKWFQVASKYPTTYYGQLAASELGRQVRIYPNSETISDQEPIKMSNFSEDLLSLLHATIALIIADEYHQVKPMISNLIYNADTKETEEIYKIIANIGIPKYSIIAAKQRSIRKLEIEGWEDLAYPIPKNIPLETLVAIAENKKVEPSFVLSIMRHESHMNQDGISHKGAVGLMQIIPSTARSLVKDGSFDNKRLRLDSLYNFILGIDYINKLSEMFNGSPVLVSAAYNAGPYAVKKWIHKFGYPEMNSKDEIINWVESIPYSETRNYVQRVVEGSAVYKIMLEKELNKKSMNAPLKSNETQYKPIKDYN